MIRSFWRVRRPVAASPWQQYHTFRETPGTSECSEQCDSDPVRRGRETCRIARHVRSPTAPSGDEGADEGTFRANLPVGRTNCRHAGNVGNHLAPDAATGSTTNAQLSRDGSRGHKAVPDDQRPSLFLLLICLLVEELSSHSPTYPLHLAL